MSDSSQPSLVLLLEDYAPAADALAMLFEDWGYECIHDAAVDGLLSALGSRAGDVRAVISDYHLGGGATGIEALAILAQAGVSAPALLLTGSSRAVARQAESAGHHFAEKPVDPERLRSWLDQTTQPGGVKSQ